MNDNEREMDLALAEAEQENRLLRARNERLEREILAAADTEAARIHNEGMVTVGHMRQQIAIEREAFADKAGEFARKWWSIHCDSNKHIETTRKAHDDFCALQAAIRARGQG
jgi:hypothetical protein